MFAKINSLSLSQLTYSYDGDDGGDDGDYNDVDDHDYNDGYGDADRD